MSRACYLQCVYRTNSLSCILRSNKERKKRIEKEDKRDKSPQLMTKVFLSNNSSSNKQKTIQMGRKEYSISDVHEEFRMFLIIVLPPFDFFLFYLFHLTPFSSLNLFNTSDYVHKYT